MGISTGPTTGLTETAAATRGRGVEFLRSIGRRKVRSAEPRHEAKPETLEEASRRFERERPVIRAFYDTHREELADAYRRVRERNPLDAYSFLRGIYHGSNLLSRNDSRFKGILDEGQRLTAFWRGNLDREPTLPWRTDAELSLICRAGVSPASPSSPILEVFNLILDRTSPIGVSAESVAHLTEENNFTAFQTALRLIFVDYQNRMERIRQRESRDTADAVLTGRRREDAFEAARAEATRATRVQEERTAFYRHALSKLTALLSIGKGLLALRASLTSDPAPELILEGLRQIAMADTPLLLAGNALQMLEGKNNGELAAILGAAYRWGRLVEAQSKQPESAGDALTALNLYLTRYALGSSARNETLKLFDDPEAVNNFILGYRLMITGMGESFSNFVDHGLTAKAVFDRPLDPAARKYPGPIETIAGAGKLARRVERAIETGDAEAVKNILLDFLPTCGGSEFAPISIPQWQKLSILGNTLAQAGAKAVPILLTVARMVQTRRYVPLVRTQTEEFAIRQLTSLAQTDPQNAVNALLDSFLARAEKDELEHFYPNAEIEGRVLVGAKVSIYPLLKRFSDIVPARFTSKWARVLRLLDSKTWRKAEALDGLIILLLEDDEILAATKKDLKSESAKTEVLTLAPLIAQKLNGHSHDPSKAS